MSSALVEQMQAAYAARPDLEDLVDGSVIDTLGLTHYEAIALAALLVVDGHLVKAFDLARVPGRPWRAALDSLQERGLVALEPDAGGVTFQGTERRLRMQHPIEVEPEDEEAPVGPPSVKLVLRPMRDQVVILAREGDTAARGLARVWTFLYGVEPKGREFGALGLIAREMGRDKGALLLLEFCHRVTTLQELIPIARSRAAGPPRPEGAPDPAEQQQYASALARAALLKRLRLYRDVNAQGEDPAARFGQQYERDIAEWRRIGRPSIDE